MGGTRAGHYKKLCGCVHVTLSVRVGEAYGTGPKWSTVQVLLMIVIGWRCHNLLTVGVYD